MNDAAVKKTSLWRDAWGDFRKAVPQYWPWILCLSFVVAVFYYFFNEPLQSDVARQFQQNPHLFKEHPELFDAYFREVMSRLVWALPLIFVVFPISYYLFAVRYLRSIMKSGQPDFSLAGFSCWYGRVAWSYLRPVLWCLIPILGAGVYFRSLIRYKAVSPLAILKRGDELKTSWAMTENNWWRIFGNYLLVVLLLMIVGFLIGVVLGIAAALVRDPFFSRLIVCYGQGIAVALGLLAASIYSVVVFRVLSEEQHKDQGLFLPR